MDIGGEFQNLLYGEMIMHTRTAEVDVNTGTRHYSLQVGRPIVFQDTLIDI